MHCILPRELWAYRVAATYCKPAHPYDAELLSNNKFTLLNSNFVFLIYLLTFFIKSRIKPLNACCHSVQNLLSSSSLSKNVKITIYRTTIFPDVLYGFETWSLNLREVRRLTILENRVLRRVIGPKRDEVTGG